MSNDPALISFYAYDYIARYGEHAESVAMHQMMDYMEEAMVAEAGLWMAVVHEIRAIQSNVLQ
jgi:hypothetical protein